MSWKTAITKITDDGEIIRGYNLEELTQKKTFVETVFLLLKGVLPTVAETTMLQRAKIPHGSSRSPLASAIVNSPISIAPPNPFIISERLLL